MVLIAIMIRNTKMTKLPNNSAHFSTDRKKTRLINLPSREEYIIDLITLTLLIVWLSLLAWLILLVGVGLGSLLKQNHLISLVKGAGLLELVCKVGWVNWVCLVLFMSLSAFLGKVVRKELKKSMLNVFLYVVFVGLLFGIVLIAWYSFPTDTKNITLVYVLHRISLALPLLWLASHVNVLIKRRATMYKDIRAKRVNYDILYFIPRLN